MDIHRDGQKELMNNVPVFRGPSQINPHSRKEKAMRQRVFVFALVAGLLPVGIASAQPKYPIMEKIAKKVIQKYQPSSCQQLAQAKSQPPSGQKAELTAINSGSRFWDNISKTPLDDLTMEPETRELLRRSAFFTPLPFVKRVVFISTPHRGSYQAALRLRRPPSGVVTIAAGPPHLAKARSKQK